MIEEARKTLQKYLDPLATVLADASLAAHLNGAGSALRMVRAGLPPPAGPVIAGGMDDWGGMRVWLPVIEGQTVDPRWFTRSLSPASWPLPQEAEPESRPSLSDEERIKRFARGDIGSCDLFKSAHLAPVIVLPVIVWPPPLLGP